MYDYFTLIRRTVQYVVAPAYCVYCKVFLFEQTIFCTTCANKIRPLVSLSLPLKRNYALKVFAIGAYEEPLKSLILAKLYSDRVASKQMATLMLERTCLSLLPCDYLIPIPLHWMRQAQRGFNQAHVMAQTLSKKMGKPTLDLIHRVKRTMPQSQIPVQQRQENINNAFMLNNRITMSCEGKHLILIDDLMTTGATLQEAANLLVALKPATISAIVTARVT